jgi:hypothetical protein
MRGLLVWLLLYPAWLFAQERCATNYIQANQPQIDNKPAFENWLKTKVAQQRIARQQSFQSLRIQQEIYRIPVVFHIIHNGSEIGQGANLSEETIQEQISILNKDFRRLNEDADDTPEEFLPVATDTEIEFLLARQDPEGLPTNGIVRVLGDSEYSPDDDQVLKSLSFWPPEDYLNIYVTNLSGGNLGYAQFPFSNLEGIATELENYRSTDGVVLDYQWVGVNTMTGTFDSYGRTATHEIGHYLGLRHIWGDTPTSCTTDDFCEDTPSARNSTSGCPGNKVSCGSNDMIENYMDYTDDECMNLFTVCQRERMRTVLEFSPRRSTLLTSHGLNEPVYVANDLGIKSIASPDQRNCTTASIPRIQVRNYGSNNISSFEVQLRLNGILVEEKEVNAFLDSLAIREVSFAPLTIPANQTNTVTFFITSVNGGVDGNNENNLKSVTIQPTSSQLLPFSESFEEGNSVYRTTENGSSSRWAFTTATDSSATNKAAFLPFFDQEANFGVQDLLLTKVLDLSSINSAQINFKYAYAARALDTTITSFHLDGLIVAVSTNCGKEFDHSDYLFERYGQELATVSDIPDTIFTTSSYTDWEEISINLTNYTGYPNVQVAFIGVNGGGNHVYLDDINVTSSSLLAYDVGFREVEKLPVVTCEPGVRPRFDIKNFGYEEIDDIELSVSLNGSPQNYLFSGLNLLSGFTRSFSLNFDQLLLPGENELVLSIDQINGLQDEQLNNNEQVYTIILEDSEEVIPVKENYELPTKWTITSPIGELLMDTVELASFTGPDNHALVARAFESEVLPGTQNYVVSPILLTGNYQKAAFRFRYSYAERVGYNDNLKVLLSTDCGQTFEEELFNMNAEMLGVVTSASEWVPAPDTPSDWKTAFIDLSEYLNWNDLRIALVFTSGNGNNLYLDDLEVLTTNDPNLPEFENRLTVYPNPADEEFRVALNLPEKQPVRMRLVDMSGRVVFDGIFPNTVNQTYTLKAPSQSGFYLLRVTGKDVLLTRRIFIR